MRRVKTTCKKSAKVKLDMPQSESFNHRRRIKKDKAKVVASVWGAEFVQFLAALAVLSIWKKRFNSAGLFGRNSSIQPFLLSTETKQQVRN